MVKASPCSRAISCHRTFKPTSPADTVDQPRARPGNSATVLRHRTVKPASDAELDVYLAARPDDRSGHGLERSR